MDNVQIVKKRLKDLKQLSLSLKQSSEKDEQLNTNILKVILNITKDISSPSASASPSAPPSPKELLSKQPTFLHHLIRANSMQEAENNISINSNINTSRQSKNMKQFHLRRIESMSYEEEEGSVDYKEEFERSNEENEELKIRVRDLQLKLEEYDNKQILQEESQNETKHLSYFRIKQLVDIFITRINVNSRDYDQIDYYPHELKLTLESIKITQTIRSPRKNRNNDSFQMEKSENENFIRLDMGDLYKVQYLHEFCMKLCFHDEGNEKYLFMKFDSFEDQHRWDIGLFINYKIIKSLGGSELFESDRSIEINAERDEDRQIKRQKSFDLNSKVKENSVQKHEKLEFDDNLLQKSFNMDSDANLSTEDRKLLISYLNEQQKFASLNRKVKQLMRSKKFQFKNAETTTLIEAPPSNTKQLIEKPKVVLQESRNNKNIINEEELIKRMEDLQLERKYMIEKKEKEEEDFKVQRVNQAKRMLKSGVYGTKYAEGALNPHEKKVFLNDDETLICWQDRGQKSYKSFPVSHVSGISQGEFGPGVEKHLKTNKIQNKNCFLTIKLKDHDRKQFQFSMNNMVLMEKFVQNLTIFLGSTYEQQDKKILF